MSIERTIGDRPKVSYEIATLSQRPQLGGQIDRIAEAAWPSFLHHTDPIH